MTQNEQRLRFGRNQGAMQNGRYNNPEENYRSRRNEASGQYRPQQSTPQQQQQNRRTLIAAKKRPTLSNRDQVVMGPVTGATSQNDNNEHSHGSNIPASNKYSWLDGEQGLWSDDEQIGDTRNREPSLAGKTKPPSPLDSSPKRQREYTSDTNHSENMEYEQSRDTTASANGINNSDQYTTHL